MLDEPLITTDHLIQMFNTQDEAGNNLGPNLNTNVSSSSMAQQKVKTLRDKCSGESLGDLNRKRILTPSKPRSDPTKKARQEIEEAIAGSD